MIVKENIEIKIDRPLKIMWLMVGTPLELHYSFKTICNFYSALIPLQAIIEKERMEYVIMKSPGKSGWNTGGDLEFFIDCVANRKTELMAEYAYKCIEITGAVNSGFYNGITVISLLQGNTFGGGMESALAGDYIMAEEHIRCSLPEVHFGIFPGMGAFSFLTRRIGFEKTCKMIYSNGKWGAAELRENGIVNWVCKTGEGENELVKKIINKQLVHPSPFFKSCNRVSMEELKEIVDIWLAEIRKLDARSIGIMQKLAGVQKERAALSALCGSV